MRMHKVHGTATGEENKRWYFDFYEQWSAFFSITSMSWIDFTFFELTVEYSPYKGSCEVAAGLLGLRLTITYVYNTARDREITEEADAMLDAYRNRKPHKHWTGGIGGNDRRLPRITGAQAMMEEDDCDRSLTEKERLNRLAWHYYAVAADLRACAQEQLRIATILEGVADGTSERAMKAADAERKPEERGT